MAIRWRPPGGTEIDTGFRADDRRDHDRWMRRPRAQQGGGMTGGGGTGGLEDGRMFTGREFGAVG